MASDIITVALDQEFTIPLRSIATAGYLWKIETLPDTIQLLGSENQKPAGDIKPGDPITQVFRFRALKAGEHTIIFMLARQWESQAIKHHTVTVNAN